LLFSLLVNLVDLDMVRHFNWTVAMYATLIWRMWNGVRKMNIIQADKNSSLPLGG